MGINSNSDEISSGKYGGGLRHRQDQQMTMNDEAFSGKNIFNYQQNVLSEGKGGGIHGNDNMSHSFNYSDYS